MPSLKLRWAAIAVLGWPAFAGCSSEASEAASSIGDNGVGSPPSTGPTYTVDGSEDAANEGDNYVAVGTNPFVLTEHDPLSTFAADVDTASYDIFRRDLGMGVLPQPESVRLEEYVNYFRYDYPAESFEASVPFSVFLDAAPNLLERDTVMLRVGIQGKAGPAFEKRPTNLVYLVDVSGSMTAEDKLPLARELLTLSLDVLDPTDTVSIVTYASGTGVRLEPTPVSDRTVIEAAIDGLNAGGSTAGAAGIDLAYAQAEAAFLEGGINHVVLCTDGDFNVGPATTAELLRLIELERDTGITLTVLGFGEGNLNDAMMEAVSNAGNGVYGVITDLDQATRYVQERLLSTMNFIAKDVKLQVEFNPSEVYAYRLLGYENRALADEQFRQDWVDAGEIGAGHQVTALYELVLTGGELPAVAGAPEPLGGDAYDGTVEVAPGDLMLVKVRYKQPGASEDDPAFEVAASLPPAQIGASTQDQSGDFQWAVAVAAFAEILKQSPYADPTLLPRIDEVVAAPNLATDADRSEFVTLLRTSRPLLGQ